ncbi:MAG: peptide MFS transporter [Bacteroidia bacterium]|nr:peptide MFS transporter [Bacteroidia bacterium]
MTNSNLGPNGFLYGGSAENQKTVLDHPVGLFVLFFTEMWERFSYYGMRALLVLFLVTEIAGGGWGWERSTALTLYGFYTGLVYLTPIFGGFIADKLLGYRKAIVLGALVMTLGHASMAIETEVFFYLGLVLLILGNGLFKPNISAVVGQLYPNSAEKKDAAYTIFYMGINAGAFLGILLCGYIGEKVGWSYGFGLAGIFMFLGMLQFHFAQKIFGDIGLEPKKETPTEKMDRIEAEEKAGTAESPAVSRDRIIVISVFAFFTIFFWMAFEQAGGSMTIFADDYTQRILTGSAAEIFFWTNTILTIAPLAIVTWVLWQLFSQIFAKYSTSNLFLGLSFVIIWGIALWMLNKEYNTKTYEIQLANQETGELRIDQQYTEGDQVFVWGETDKLKVVADSRKGSYSSEQEVTVVAQKKDTLEVPASWFGILNSFFIISFAPIFGKIWESKYNPSGPTKFGIGLILLGLGFAVLAYGGMDIGKGAQTASVSMWWLIIAYWLHTMGELCVSPVGLSYVSKLAPVKLVGLMFGIWFVANFIANTLAGLSGSLIDKISEAYSISGFFLIFTAIPVAAGLVMLALNKTLIKKMHGYR